MLGRVLIGWSVSLVAGVPLAAVVASAAWWHASYLLLALLLAGAALALARRRDVPTGETGDRRTDRA